jgi:hypothetical protein
VGGPDGPIATAEQLRAVKDDLNALIVGCNCRGTSVGNSHYPCILELGHPKVMIAAPEDREVVEGWWATSADIVTRYALGVVEAASLSDRAKANEPSVGLPSVMPVSADFLGLAAPRQYRLIASSATAKALRFSAFAHASEFGNSQIEPSSGLVILSTRRLRPDPPWPYTDRSI